MRHESDTITFDGIFNIPSIKSIEGRREKVIDPEQEELKKLFLEALPIVLSHVEKTGTGIEHLGLAFTKMAESLPLLLGKKE
jgi:hypothetical protein